MLIRPRHLFGPALALGFLAIPALVLAATLSVAGTATGTADTKAPAPGATCDTASPTQASDYVCDSTVGGPFTLTELGTGTYAGDVQLDWSIYTGTEPCAEASGTVTFTNGADSITTTLASTSRVCESQPASNTYTMALQSNVTAGTGRFASATGNLDTLGNLVKTATPGQFTITEAIQGSVTVPDPAPAATATPTATATAAPVAAASPAPGAGMLPDTSTDGPDGGLLLVLGLGAIIAASAGRRALKAASQR